MTTLPNMGLTLPTQGAPGAGTWDDVLDANSALVDAHNHTPGKGVAIPTAGININADLSFGSLYSPTNLHRLTFASIVALSSNNKSLFVSDADNELYWRSNTGANVKLTSGSALNVSAFTGGIGGDYAAVAAAVNFDDAGDRYTFKQNAGTGWARLACGDVRLFETGTSDTVFVGLAAPAALAGSYTITMPLAAPTTGTRPVQMTTTGVITAGNSDNVQVGGTLGVTGAATLSSTLDVGGILSSTGLIFGQNGITSAVNTHFTASGTGRYKHGTFTQSIHGSGFVGDFASGNVSWSLATGISIAGPGVATTVMAPISLTLGSRITAIRVFCKDSATGPTTLQASLRTLTSGGVQATVASSSASAGSGANQTLTVSPAATTTVTGTLYLVAVVVTAGTAACSVYGAEVDYDEP